MSKKSVFRVGDLVRYQMFTGPITGVVTEDRGNIGVGGRRLIRIRYAHEEPFFMETEVPEAELELIKPKKNGKGRMRAKKTPSPQ
jgi:hypothetical protein